jgi:hypothetical protein
VQAFLEILLKYNYMMTLLMVVAVLGQSFDIAPYDLVIDTQVIESALCDICRKDAMAEIALSDVRLEPVHDSTTWLSLTSAKVERTAWNGGTQGDTYFK